MAKLHSFLKFIQKKKWWSVSAVGTILLIILLTHLGGNGKIETVTARTEDLIRTVKISGKVSPRERVDLAFEISGTVSYVGKPVGAEINKGEVLVRLDPTGASADIQKAEAELASAQAELNKLEGTEAYENSIDNAKRSLVQVMREAYTTASDSVQNKSDQVFLDPRGYNPIISGKFVGLNDTRNYVNKTRVDIGFMLDDWQNLVNTLSPASYSQDQLVKSKEYLAKVTTFISSVSNIVNIYEPSDFMSQTRIDQHKASLLSARESLDQVSQDFIDAENTLSKLMSDVPVQLARVEAAKANVSNLRFNISKTALVSPFSGIVAKQDAKIGQSVSTGENLASVMTLDYIIETYVPEVSIAGIQLGNPATVTLDAYGSQDIFQASVQSVDPVETIRDGVSTYKVKLSFNQADTRIRSGMTANVEIETLRKPSVTLIPDRSVVKDAEGTFVYILENGGNKRKVPVVIGEKDSKGGVEVISGITTSDKIIVNPED